MNWQQLFAIQKRLDDRILAEHGLERSALVQPKLLALHTELCELANETRCFKYWSLKPAAPRETILEEYVDAVHFVLSLGIDWEFTFEAAPVEEPEAADLTASFLRVIETVSRLGAASSAGDKPDAAAYHKLAGALLALGRQLGFSEEEIETAYLAKNELNHRRQQEGY